MFWLAVLSAKYHLDTGFSQLCNGNQNQTLALFPLVFKKILGESLSKMRNTFLFEKQAIFKKPRLGYIDPWISKNLYATLSFLQVLVSYQNCPKGNSQFEGWSF